MNIIVLAKVVKHLQAQTGSDPKQNYIGPGDIVDRINPADETAVEAALRIKDDDPGAELSVVSLGGSSAEKELRRFLAMGADRATHVVCDDDPALDSWATANALARAVEEAGFRLILCGREAIDGNAGLVGAYVAEILGIPHVSRVVHIEPQGDDEVVVHRTVERHDTEILACALPALLTVEPGINVVRTPSMPAMLQARSRPIETRALAGLSRPGEAPLGAAMNRTEVVRLSRPKPRRAASAQVDPQLSAADRMKLMMKGGGAKPAQTSSLREGISDDVLAEMERLLKSCGVTFKPTN